MTDLIPPEAITAAAFVVPAVAEFEQEVVRVLRDHLTATPPRVVDEDELQLVATSIAEMAQVAVSPILRKADADTISSLMGSVRAAEDIIANRDRYISHLENRLAALEGVSPC